MVTAAPLGPFQNVNSQEGAVIMEEGRQALLRRGCIVLDPKHISCGEGVGAIEAGKSRAHWQLQSV